MMVDAVKGSFEVSHQGHDSIPIEFADLFLETEISYGAILQVQTL